MRVLIDATAIPADRGGVGRYIDELVAALARLGADLVVSVQPRDADAMATLAPGSEVVPLPGWVRGRAGRMAWEQSGLPALARGVRADVLHCPHYTMPARSPIPVVVTLHDATFFSHPEVHTAVKARFFRTATQRAVRRAAALVVPSRATGSEVRRYVGGDEARFHVAYHGVDSQRFHPVGEDERRRAASALGIGAYVGFLGTLEPRKNLPALVRGWTRAVERLEDPPALVLAGAPGWDGSLDDVVASVPSGLTVLRPGYLPLADLPGFLAGATVLAYPSLGEGFGLPVLEAMACGATVLTTRELSLPEVGGDAVAYCGVSDAEIATGLSELLADPSHRTRLARAAVERAAGFTWDASAEQHEAAYRAAARSRTSAA
jgi:glycosyltransferase involved in cell wall biosynthesis